MTKPVIIKTKKGRKFEGYLDDSREILFTQYTTTQLAKQAGWTWEEQEEQKVTAIGPHYYGEDNCEHCAHHNGFLDGDRADIKIFCGHFGLKVNPWDTCKNYKPIGGQENGKP